MYVHVMVLGCDEGDIRLTQSTDYSYLDGRVEICRSNLWGTVCEYQWSSVGAMVACRQLGLNPHGIINTNSYACYY